LAACRRSATGRRAQWWEAPHASSATTTWQFLEELDHLGAAQLPTKHRLLCGIDAVHLKNALCRIEANAGNVCHGRLPL
jgi:hypothetical protein